MLYRQCELIRDDCCQVAFIPEKFAEVGRVLRINEDDGFIVTEVYAPMSSEGLDLVRDARLDRQSTIQ